MEKLYTVSKNKTGSWLWLRSWTPYCQGKVTQSCPTLCDPMGCSLPGSSVHAIFQAIVLEWIVISFSKGSSRPRDRTRVSHIVDRHLTVWATREVLLIAKSRCKQNKVGKTTRPFRYDLNQIPYDYTVEVRNRFKGLDLTECLRNCGWRFITL